MYRESLGATIKGLEIRVVSLGAVVVPHLEVAILMEDILHTNHISLRVILIDVFKHPSDD